MTFTMNSVTRITASWASTPAWTRWLSCVAHIPEQKWVPSERMTLYRSSPPPLLFAILLQLRSCTVGTKDWSSDEPDMP